MKQALIYIGMLLLAISCGRNRDRLHTGRLPLPGRKKHGDDRGDHGGDGQRRAAEFLTRGDQAVVGGGADSVLEATTDGGVRLTLLAEFLGRSAKIDGHPAVVAMRLKDTAGIAAAVRRARSFLGVPYDYSFRPGREKLYCSELVWESYRAEDGTPLFTARPMNFRAADGTLPQFWADLFDQLGEQVPEGLPGTNPNDMAREELSKKWHRYF